MTAARCHVMFVFLSQSMLFGKQIYNDRRLFLGGGQGVLHGAGASSQAADKRSGRGKGMHSLLIHVVFVLHR